MEHESGEIQAAGMSRDAGEEKIGTATKDTLTTPPHCDWKEYRRERKPDGGEPDRDKSDAARDSGGWRSPSS